MSSTCTFPCVSGRIPNEQYFQHLYWRVSYRKSVHRLVRDKGTIDDADRNPHNFGASETVCLRERNFPTDNAKRNRNLFSLGVSIVNVA
jgi:hypothetical protein